MRSWPRYPNGLNVADIAPPAYAANPITGPAPIILSEGFDQVIERAYRYIYYKPSAYSFDAALLNIIDYQSYLSVKMAKYVARNLLMKQIVGQCLVDRAIIPASCTP
jgi:hypothetical protein